MKGTGLRKKLSKLLIGESVATTMLAALIVGVFVFMFAIALTVPQPTLPSGNGDGIVIIPPVWVPAISG